MIRLNVSDGRQGSRSRAKKLAESLGIEVGEVVRVSLALLEMATDGRSVPVVTLNDGKLESVDLYLAPEWMAKAILSGAMLDAIAGALADDEIDEQAVDAIKGAA